MHPKLCLNIQVKQDVTGGCEKLPIHAFNMIDNADFPDFKYVTSCIEPKSIADIRDITTLEVYAAITDKNCNHFV